MALRSIDLMIGDWVQNPLGWKAQVQSIRYVNTIKDEWEWLIKIGINNETFQDHLSLTEIEPIPLTPEILWKNGWIHEFDKKDYMVKYDLAVEGKNCWMMWAVKEHNLDIQRQDEKLDFYNLKVQRVCMPCDFVHQLQNALRLCGIEKEITIQHMKAIDEIEEFVTKEANHWKEKMNNKSGYDLVEASARFSECSKILAMITGLRNTLDE